MQLLGTFRFFVRLVQPLLSIGLSLGLWFGFPSNTLAQPSIDIINSAIDTEPTMPIDRPQSSFDASAISSEKLSSFVHVYLQVLALRERRESELQGAETESESQRIEQEIVKEALTLIEISGLTLNEYLQLLNLANVDPEFSERVVAQLQESTL